MKSDDGRFHDDPRIAALKKRKLVASSRSTRREQSGRESGGRERMIMASCPLHFLLLTSDF